MNTYQIITLVDITRTHANREELDTRKKSQQANFDSLRQAIELRSNIEWSQDPESTVGRLPPNTCEGRARYWCWQFSVEREAVFDDGVDSAGLLTLDLHGVPIITGLAETCDLFPAAFLTQGHAKNTWITQIN